MSCDVVTRMCNVCPDLEVEATPRDICSAITIGQ